MALLMDAAYELFGFLRCRWVDVTQETLQRESACPGQSGRIFERLWRTIHIDRHSSAAAGGLIWIPGKCAPFSIRCSRSAYWAPNGLSFVVPAAPDFVPPAGNCQPSSGLKRTSFGRQKCR